VRGARRPRRRRRRETKSCTIVSVVRAEANAASIRDRDASGPGPDDRRARAPPGAARGRAAPAFGGWGAWEGLGSASSDAGEPAGTRARGGRARPSQLFAPGAVAVVQENDVDRARARGRRGRTTADHPARVPERDSRRFVHRGHENAPRGRPAGAPRALGVEREASAPSPNSDGGYPRTCVRVARPRPFAARRGSDRQPRAPTSSPLRR
jgi:hypothetical protein